MPYHRIYATHIRSSDIPEYAFQIHYITVSNKIHTLPGGHDTPIGVSFLLVLICRFKEDQRSRNKREKRDYRGEVYWGQT